MAEYRATIGRFAALATQLCQKYKRKQVKSKSVKVKKCDNNSKEELLKSDNYNRSWGSLDRETTRKRKDSEHLRSTTCCSQTKIRGTRRICSSLRERSPSCAERGRTSFSLSKESLKDVCTACKTEWVKQVCQRGRARKGCKQLNQKHNCIEKNPGKLIGSKQIGPQTVGPQEVVP